ncbi:MAG: DUF5357 family protein [Elainellaceae cyanobacterium]
MLEKMLETSLKQLEKYARETLEFFRPKEAFSWQTFFLLGCFSWGMAILSVERSEIRVDMVMPPATWVLYTMGWIFITLAVGWGMVKKTTTIPFLNITIKPAIWVTSGLASAFAFPLWNPSTRAIAFVSWPIVFAIFSALPRFAIISENKYNIPNPAARQEMVLTTLICLLISSWIRVHFVAQDWALSKYPALVAGNFSQSTFVVQLGEPPPVLDIAERTVNETLRSRPIPVVRSWLVRAADNLTELNDEFQKQLEDQGIDPNWELNIAPDKIYNPELRLQVFPLISAVDAENEAQLRSPQEREAAEQDEPVPPSERLRPRPTRIGLERRCRIFSKEAYEKEQSTQPSTQPSTEPSPDEPQAPPNQNGNGSAENDSSRNLSDDRFSRASAPESRLNESRLKRVQASLYAVNFYATLLPGNESSPAPDSDPEPEPEGASPNIIPGVESIPGNRGEGIDRGGSSREGSSREGSGRDTEGQPSPLTPAPPTRSSSYLSRMACDRAMMLISRRGS